MTNHASPAAAIDPSNGLPVHPTRYAGSIRLALATTGRIVLTMVAMIAMLLPAVGVAAGLGAIGLGGSARDIVAHVAVFVTILPVAWLLRNRLEGDPATYLALGWRGGRALGALVVGLVVAVAIIGTPSLVAAVQGVAGFGSAPTDDPLALRLLYVLTVSFFLQGFPEEVLWRGYLQTTLMARLSPVTAAVLSAVFFGSMHLMSVGSGDTWVGKLGYVAGAIGMGLVMAGLRLVTGSTWAAVGYHTGFHLTTRIPVALGFQATGEIDPALGLLLPVAQILVGLGLLLWWRQTHRTPASVVG